MKLFYKTVLIFLAAPLFSLAQSNYKPGSVVTLKGDTLHGFIDDQAWTANPTTISFKTTITDSKSQKFTTDDISYFDVAGLETYQKFAGAISMDETNTGHLNAGRDTSYRTAVVFLKLLQKGKNVALFSYTDNVKTRYYLGEAPGYVPAELVFRLYDAGGTAVPDKQGSVIVGNTVYENTYQKMLFALANKYNALDDDLARFFESASYTSPDLLTIVSKINNISATELKNKYTQKTKLAFYAGTALNITSNTSASGSSYTAGGGKGYTSYSPGVSLGISIDPNPNSGRFQLRAGLSLTQAKFLSEYQLKVSPYIPFKASFNQTIITIEGQIIYNFYNAKNLKIFGGLGFDFNSFKYSNPYFAARDPKAGVDFSAEDPYMFNTADNSFVLKAGVLISRRLEIFASYITPTATTQGAYWQMNNTREQVGIVYLFGL